MTSAPEPKRNKAKERHASILGAAERLLLDEGHAALTMRRLASELGMSLSNLQYYFATREALVKVLLDRLLEEAESRVKELIQREADPAQALRAAARELLDEHQDPGSCRLFYELWALAARDEVVREALHGFYARYAQVAAQALRGAVPRLSKADARARAEVLIALLEGASLFRSGTLGKRSLAADRVLDQLIAQLIS